MTWTLGLQSRQFELSPFMDAVVKGAVCVSFLFGTPGFYTLNIGQKGVSNISLALEIMVPAWKTMLNLLKNKYWETLAMEVSISELPTTWR